ncbi:MAG: tRNA 2-selenouridine(34) synthase MnmH [Bacteroidota bacterium]
MIERITIEKYIEKYNGLPIIDVRSPGEYKKGHIINAVNIPLFSNDERAIIGTIYKQVSKDAAIEKGYELVNPKLDHYIEASLDAAPEKTIIVHCWRGGMRSESFAQHLHNNGFEKVYVLEGGYKAYRRAVLSFFEQKFKLIILGGYTGSGKTEILHEIAKTGKQVIDLEGLANHKGSAFGGIGQNEQPSVEHFQNMLFEEMTSKNLSDYIWLEDESLNIGKARIPESLFKQMREQRVFFVDIPRSERAFFLTQTYGKQHKDKLEESILKIHKRLGPLNTKIAIEALNNNDLLSVAEISLIYYDKAYLRGVENRDPNKISIIKLKDVDHYRNANTISDRVIKIINKTDKVFAN